MINGKGLMIGDYVDVNGNNDIIVPGVVKEIRDEGKQLTVSINDDKFFDICADEDVFPIKLTEEFLLKNGFTGLYADEHIVRLYDHDIRLRVNTRPPGYCFRCRVPEIGFDFVHEFQHYLRLANLSDYANNLKL